MQGMSANAPDGDFFPVVDQIIDLFGYALLLLFRLLNVGTQARLALGIGRDIRNDLPRSAEKTRGTRHNRCSGELARRPIHFNELVAGQLHQIFKRAWAEKIDVFDAKFLVRRVRPFRKSSGIRHLCENHSVGRNELVQFCDCSADIADVFEHPDDNNEVVTAFGEIVFKSSANVNRQVINLFRKCGATR